MTRAQTTTNADLHTDVQVDESVGSKKIWMEIMKFKVQKGLEGDEEVPKREVIRIRKEVKVERAKQKRKERRQRSKASKA